MSRLLSALVAGALILAPLPALAGPSEEAFLAKPVSTWKGSGTLAGGATGTLACASTIRTAGKGITFRVKCDVPEYGAQTFSGTVTYNDKEGRYEAKSPGGQVTIGTKSGNTVIFAAKMKGIAAGTSVMKMTTTRITVDTNVKRPGSSGEIKSHMVLTKS
jgi:hypothetical protein